MKIWVSGFSIDFYSLSLFCYFKKLFCSLNNIKNHFYDLQQDITLKVKENCSVGNYGTGTCLIPKYLFLIHVSEFASSIYKCIAFIGAHTQLKLLGRE